MPKGDQSLAPPLVQPTFDQRVWSVVEQIPHGRLATYGQIADLIGAWGCARQVGWALRRLQLPTDVPWHRVVNAKETASKANVPPDPLEFPP